MATREEPRIIIGQARFQSRFTVVPPIGRMNRRFRGFLTFPGFQQPFQKEDSAIHLKLDAVRID